MCNENRLLDVCQAQGKKEREGESWLTFMSFALWYLSTRKVNYNAG